MKDIVEIKNLTHKYDGPQKNALTNISFKIKKGSFFGLLGPNGAGKSTLLSYISGQSLDIKNNIFINGQNIKTLKEKILSIGYAPQELALYPMLTIYENLKFFASLSKVSKSEISENIKWALKATNLLDHTHKKVTALSGGMKRRLNLAVSILNRPELIILDEPTVGIDLQSRSMIFDTLRDLHKTGTSIIYTSHYMEEIQKLCDDMIVLSDGKILYEGSVENLCKDKALEESYLLLTKNDQV